MLKTIICSSVTIALLCCSFTKATDCDSDRLKVYVKINDTLWDDYEEYLLRATIAYSVKKFCGGAADTDVDPSTYDCNFGDTADTDTTTATNYTVRISYCIKVENVNVETVRVAIKESKANLNGALILTDEELVVQGILPTIKPPVTYSFEPWLIAYIVFTGLIILGGLLIVYFTMRSPKDIKEDFDEDKKRLHEDNEAFEDEETGGSTEDVSTRM